MESLAIHKDKALTPFIIEGYNPLTAKGAPELLSGISADYTFPASAVDMTLSSTSVNDVVRGTGARTVSVSYISTDGEVASADYEMKGQTGIVIPAVFRVLTLTIHTTGSLAKNDGDIYIGTGTITGGKPAVPHEQISRGLGAATSCKFSVRPHTRFYIESLTVFSVKGTYDINWELRIYNEGTIVKTIKGLSKAGLEYKWTPEHPIELLSGYDVALFTIDVSTSDIAIIGRIEGIIKQK